MNKSYKPQSPSKRTEEKRKVQGFPPVQLFGKNKGMMWSGINTKLVQKYSAVQNRTFALQLQQSTHLCHHHHQWDFHTCTQSQSKTDSFPILCLFLKPPSKHSYN